MKYESPITYHSPLGGGCFGRLGHFSFQARALSGGVRDPHMISQTSSNENRGSF